MSLSPGWLRKSFYTCAHTTAQLMVLFLPTGQQSLPSHVLFSSTGHSKVNSEFDLGTKAGVPGRVRGPHSDLPQQKIQAPCPLE